MSKQNATSGVSVSAMKTSPNVTELSNVVDLHRRDVARNLNPILRASMGQYLTPQPVAGFMASMFETSEKSIHLLDAGAGIGSLTAAFVSEMCQRGPRVRPNSIAVTAYETDDTLISFLQETLEHCQKVCHRAAIHFSVSIRKEDFVRAAVSMLRHDLYAVPQDEYVCAILNPPYRKIHSNSEARQLLRTIGIETTNLYTAFLFLVMRLLRGNGELVAITPRSFCNGPYFKTFRKEFIATMALRRVHIFESRKQAFQDDQVLQENVILHAVKGAINQKQIVMSSTIGPNDPHPQLRTVSLHEAVHREDSERIIHIVSDDYGSAIAQRMSSLVTTPLELGLSVSTGRVVDFRAKRFLRHSIGRGKAPLLHPGNLVNGFATWPLPHKKKHIAIAICQETEDLLIPSAVYVVVKRFSSKEERRRIVAAIYDPQRVRAELVGFENHLNYFHCKGSGLAPVLARGLLTYLNSSVVDNYFRQFSGHTQVNASDLRRLPYPTYKQLIDLGSIIIGQLPKQEDLDQRVEEVLFSQWQAPPSTRRRSKRR